MSVAIFESDGVTPLTHLTQWDTNRNIIIRGLGLDNMPACHFYNVHSKQAIVVNASISNDDITVPVPNIILQEGLSLVMDVYYGDGFNITEFVNPPVTEGKVIYSFRIPVNPKPIPSDYRYEENIEYASWVELSARANLLISTLQNTDFRKNSSNATIEYTTNGSTWKTLLNVIDLKGKTAYEGAVEKGYTGTEAEFDIDNAQNTLTQAEFAALEDKLGITV